MVELLLGHETGFVTKEQGGVIDEALDFLRRDFASGGDLASGDRVIKIQQHLSQIENNGAWCSHSRESDYRLGLKNRFVL